MGVSQPRVSSLMRGKIELFTIDALVNMLTSARLRLWRRGSRAWKGTGAVPGASAQPEVGGRPGCCRAQHQSHSTNSAINRLSSEEFLSLFAAQTLSAPVPLSAIGVEIRPISAVAQAARLAESAAEPIFKGRDDSRPCRLDARATGEYWDLGLISMPMSISAPTPNQSQSGL